MIETLSQTAKNDSRATLLAAGFIFLALCLHAVVFFIGDPALLRFVSLVYVGSTVTIALWLYATNAPLYVGFVWWIWFLSPFARRLFDYATGSYTPPNMAIALLAPYMATGISVLDLFRFGQRMLKWRYVPIGLCLIGILYGFLVGLPKIGIMGSTVSLLDWLCPLLLAFHVLARPEAYPRFRRVIRTTFVGGVLVLGAYGVFQFFFAPPWDTMWMKYANMLSIGRPEPMMIRVFGTLDSPGPYAMVMMAGLLFLFEARTLFAKIAAIPGFLGFLLALVRGAWGGWVLGIGYTLLRGTKMSRSRVAVVLALLLAIVIPLASTGTIGNRTGERMETFSNLEEDGSLQARQYMYRTKTIDALMNPIGEGLGGKSLDSGFLTLIYQLGWLGSFFYLAGLFLMMKSIVFNVPPDGDDSFGTISAGIAVSFFALMLLGPQMTEIKGCLFWMTMSLVIVSRVHRKQRTEMSDDGGSRERTSTALAT